MCFYDIHFQNMLFGLVPLPYVVVSFSFPLALNSVLSLFRGHMITLQFLGVWFSKNQCFCLGIELSWI